MKTQRLLLVGGLLLAVGCSFEAPSGKVGGTVTFQGRPLTQGDVSFYCQEKGVGAIAKIDESGRYAIETPIAAGEYVVTVMPPTVDPVPGVAPPRIDTSKFPMKYRQAATSGLKVTVGPGMNDFPIQMTN